MRLLLVALLVACGTTEAPKPATPASPTPAPAAPAAPPAQTVGPDGPSGITVPAIAAISTDAADITAGETIFGQRGCGGCHNFGSKLVGPDLVGVTSRRTVPWVEKMVMEPDVMLKQDPVAKDLLKQMMTPMPKQGVTAEEMPKLLAFIKSKGG